MFTPCRIKSPGYFKISNFSPKLTPLHCFFFQVLRVFQLMINVSPRTTVWSQQNSSERSSRFSRNTLRWMLSTPAWNTAMIGGLFGVPRCSYFVRREWLTRSADPDSIEDLSRIFICHMHTNFMTKRMNQQLHLGQHWANADLDHLPFCTSCKASLRTNAKSPRPFDFRAMSHTKMADGQTSLELDRLQAGGKKEPARHPSPQTC